MTSRWLSRCRRQAKGLGRLTADRDGEEGDIRWYESGSIPLGDLGTPHSSREATAPD